MTDASSSAGVSGASVTVEGTQLGAATGNTGRYRITGVPVGTHTVVVQQVGYAEAGQSVTVSDGEEATADFALEVSALPLDEIVATGTAFETRVRTVPNPISVITAREIEQKQSTNITDLLRGEIPGVMALSNGQGDFITRIYVRGKASWTSADYIKIYIDGVEVADPSYLSTINPNTIERIEVVRGPQASAIYGSEASSGVLQIFTKKGRPGLARRGRRLLLRGGYAVDVAGGQAWILKTPEREPDRDLCLRNYWKVVQAILTNYEPAVLERESAVQLYLEDATPPARLRMRQGRSRSNYTFQVCDDLEVQVMPGEVVLDEAKRVAVHGAALLVDRPERTLLALPLTSLRDHLERVAVWLSALVVSRPALEREWARMPRPLVIRRLAEMAGDSGNRRLAEQLDALLAAEHGDYISRARTGVGTEVIIPRVISRAQSTSPWLARHEVTFRRFFEQMTEAVASDLPALPGLDRTQLVRQARAAKTYDAYHSTTIEGYRITPEEVSAVIAGSAVAGHDPEDVKARMAVQGYSVAFDRCLAVANRSEDGLELTDSLILALYRDLFSPSVEAGIIDADALHGWRTSPAYLRGARYVPPSAEKVPALMHQHVRLANELREPAIVRAALAHLDFVAIHPFPDGNGRIARFLMNLCLVTAGFPWVTIRTDDRIRYFEALAAATVGEDAAPFARFVLDYVARATDSS